MNEGGSRGSAVATINCVSLTEARVPLFRATLNSSFYQGEKGATWGTQQKFCSSRLLSILTTRCSKNRSHGSEC